MGIELDLSELAAQVTARPDDDGEGAAADTGCCVTPTTASESVAPRQDGGVDDNGCVTPTASGAGATARRGGVEDGAAGCATPTSAASALRPAAACPPAPRKPRPAKRKRCGAPTPPQRFFFPVPHDLATVFVARVAAPPPCPARPTKKQVRVHVVG